MLRGKARILSRYPSNIWCKCMHHGHLYTSSFFVHQAPASPTHHTRQRGKGTFYPHSPDLHPAHPTPSFTNPAILGTAPSILVHTSSTVIHTRPPLTDLPSSCPHVHRPHPHLSTYPHPSFTSFIQIYPRSIRIHTPSIIIHTHYTLICDLRAPLHLPFRFFCLYCLRTPWA